MTARHVPRPVGRDVARLGSVLAADLEISGPQVFSAGDFTDGGDAKGSGVS